MIVVHHNGMIYFDLIRYGMIRYGLDRQTDR